jgi:hypothetical protein
MNSLTLSQDIRDEYDRLVKVVTHISPSVRTSKIIEGTGGKVSVADIIAYQIGWGKCLIRWYEAGIQGKVPEMPGNGFLTWDYLGIAQHFYQLYQLDSSDEQMRVFHQVVLRILEIVVAENQTGNLDRTGIWSWCTLPSGKHWPLSKWIRVNTASPYKRATRLIKRGR